MIESEWVFSSLPLSLRDLVDVGELAAVRGLFESLPAGSWLTATTIEKRLGWKHSAQNVKVRRVIKELQLQLFPLVESHAGFAVASRPEMIDRCIEKEEQRIRGLVRTIGALRDARAAMTYSKDGGERGW